MDEPICYRVSPYPHLEPQDYHQRLTYAIKDDDKDLFFSLMKDPEFDQVHVVYCLARQIFEADALKIGTAVLNGETKYIIDLEHVLEDGMTPLHLAAVSGAPRLTKYLLQRGDDVDATCDFNLLNLRQATPIDVAVGSTAFNGESSRWTPDKSLFDLLLWLCKHNGRHMEVVRLLVLYTLKTRQLQQAFINYADEGQLVQLTVLFMAAPELFVSPYFESLGGELSSFSMLFLVLSSLKKRTYIEEGSLLLFDVLAMVGDKLVAYIRLRDFSEQTVLQTQLEISFLLREATHKKLGVYSPDYFLRFFKPLRPGAIRESKDDDAESLDDLGYKANDPRIINFLPFLLTRKNVDHAYIYRMLPSLAPEDAGRLNKAIKKKLSSMSTLQSYLEEEIPKITKREETYLPQRVSFPSGLCFEPNVRSFHTFAGSAKHMLDFKSTLPNSWENKVMKPTKLKSVSSLLKLSHLPMFAKRLIK